MVAPSSFMMLMVQSVGHQVDRSVATVRCRQVRLLATDDCKTHQRLRQDRDRSMCHGGHVLSKKLSSSQYCNEVLQQKQPWKKFCNDSCSGVFAITICLCVCTKQFDGDLPVAGFQQQWFYRIPRRFQSSTQHEQNGSDIHYLVL